TLVDAVVQIKGVFLHPAMDVRDLVVQVLGEVSREPGGYTIGPPFDVATGIPQVEVVAADKDIIDETARSRSVGDNRRGNERVIDRHQNAVVERRLRQEMGLSLDILAFEEEARRRGEFKAHV